ncbi:DUF2088 domain-containing protein, partial [candidate division WOR-3 bacterium]|nr:DUF2088 domain-containing protein [candidate division WOR-3 bacterium]
MSDFQNKSENVNLEIGLDSVIPNNKWTEKVETLKDKLGSFTKLLIVVNDQERNTPTAEILDVLAKDPYIQKISSVIIASGTHKNPSEDQLNRILGKFKPREIIFHESKDPQSLKFFGVSVFGNEIYLNRVLGDFDAVLAINSVEPHYFAGFTGGRKSFLPGIAGFSTIEKNHSLALEPGA